MSLSGSTDVRNEQAKLTENEQLSQDDDRFNGGSSANENSFKSTGASLAAIDSNSKVVDLSPSSKNVDLLDNSEKAIFSLGRLGEQQMVHGMVDQNNNEYFTTGSYLDEDFFDSPSLILIRSAFPQILVPGLLSNRNR